MRDIFFLHIPKCAGCSVLAACGDRVINAAHGLPSEYGQFYGRRFAQGYKFTVVRHPFDRFVSAYCYITQETPEHPCWILDQDHRTFLAQYSTLADFVLAHATPPQALLHFIPQVSWLRDYLLDRVMRYEYLHEEWPHMRTQFGFANLPYVNVGQHAAWSSILQPPVIERLRQWYAEDFNYLGYD